METIILGGGCFWCLDAIFQRVMGVEKLISGYSGGQTKNPTYKEICTGNTGHAEVLKIEFENIKISLDEILDIFWQIHDPTTLNRQGNDVGTQYRSVIYYMEKSQETIIKNLLKNFENLTFYKNPIITEIKQLDKFYSAEDYHQDYYKNNSTQPYCSFVIHPKIKKFEEMIKKK